MRLEDLTKGAIVKGVLPDLLITVIDTQWHGSDVVTLTYRDTNGITGDELIFREREAELEIVTSSLPWSFNGDSRMFRLVSEAHRIQLAHLFDPMLAVHTSLVEPLPHQITAVYGDMLPRQPTIDLVLERHRNILKQGSILVDENDPNEEVRILVTLQHSILGETHLNGLDQLVNICT